MRLAWTWRLPVLSVVIYGAMVLATAFVPHGALKGKFMAAYVLIAFLPIMLSQKLGLNVSGLAIIGLIFGFWTAVTVLSGLAVDSLLARLRKPDGAA